MTGDCVSDQPALHWRRRISFSIHPSWNHVWGPGIVYEIFSSRNVDDGLLLSWTFATFKAMRNRHS
jgi:hypothetical protein